MNRFLMLLAALVLAQSAVAANDPPQATSTRSYTYWLHPKLGMVKVDRATHAMLVGKRQQGQAAGR